MKKKWQITKHALKRLDEREGSISLSEIFSTLEKPDEIVFGRYGRKIYHKRIRNGLLRVVVSDFVVITFYWTRKVKKYWKGGKENEG